MKLLATKFGHPYQTVQLTRRFHHQPLWNYEKTVWLCERTEAFPTPIKNLIHQFIEMNWLYCECTSWRQIVKNDGHLGDIWLSQQCSKSAVILFTTQTDIYYIRTILLRWLFDPRCLLQVLDLCIPVDWPIDSRCGCHGNVRPLHTLLLMSLQSRTLWSVGCINHYIIGMVSWQCFDGEGEG